ncbi:MAG TPA: hypothetical protein VFJ09_00025 [Nocardioidaceae bacterium]|nr:hypothetical protein [Nocardioidaceae bacterium]
MSESSGGEFVTFGPGSPTSLPAPVPPGDPAAPRPGRGRRLVAGGLATVLVGAVVAGGLVVGQFLSGGGTQPEDVLPAATVAFAKIDLDPSAGQKINALRLMDKFPRARSQGDDLKAALVQKWFDDNPYGLTYRHDLAPWLGDRAAVAAVATPGGKDDFTELLALQFTDRDAMTTALDRADAAMGKEDGTGFHYAVRDDYVLITRTRADATAFGDTAAVLADDPTYAADAERIDAADQIVLGWVNLGHVVDLLPANERRTLAEDLGSAHPKGSFIAGLHVEPSYVELAGQTHGFDPTGTNLMAASHPGTSLVRGLPSDVTGAVSVTGLGPALAKLWDRYQANDALGLAGQAQQYGLHLPGDIEAVFGSELAVGVKARQHTVDVVSRVATDRPERAQQVVEQVVGMTGEPDFQVRSVDGGYVAGTDPAMLDTAAAGDGGLGSNPAFTEAVKDADRANAVLYVNIADLVRLYGNAKDKRQLAPLSAFGMSSTGTSSDGQFTMRLTVK